MNALSPEQTEHLRQALNKAYATPEELRQTLDNLLYALFYLDGDSVPSQQQQDFAFLIHTIRKAISEGEE